MAAGRRTIFIRREWPVSNIRKKQVPSIRKRRGMETELAALAQSGAATLVGLMVSDSWAEAKAGFARLFARGGTVDDALRELESSQDELTVAHARGDDTEAADIELEWRSQLRRLLRSDPTATDELRRLIGRLSSSTIYNINNGDVRFGSVIQAAHISGGAIGGVPSPPDGA